ncbi:HAMP domain-containing protein [Betaproteobacteria bacterium SCN1]|nr:HAMP domain-containing protein [Betaproteobacteria bacterium SCN1]
MEWIRRVSLVQRIVIGFSIMGLMMATLGVAAIAALPDTHGSTAWGMGATAGLGCALAAFSAWAIRRSIKDSVESTIECVTRIAGGDLDTRIDSPGKDEISWLRAELNSMRKKLRQTVLDVRQAVDSVSTVTREIASGNVDLSARTENQASALQQTSSSMQLLAGTVESNARNTEEVRNVVTQSSTIAQRGAETMRDAVARMREIHASATRIGEIVSVIDSIAFQTNILALNAAVEAARAGDNGRGFAVVAAEVRALAQNSANAAREIKQLIDESTAKVDAGARLVDDAGKTMQEILDSVGRVSQLTVDIAQAGHSQSSDIGQMNEAIAQIDATTQQNAALVQQLASAAQSLETQSSQLGQAMEGFRIAA